MAAIAALPLSRSAVVAGVLVLSLVVFAATTMLVGELVVRLGSFVMEQGVTTGVRTVGGTALVDFLNRDTNGRVTFILVRDTPGSGRSDLVHGFATKRHPYLPPPTLKVTVMPKR